MVELAAINEAIAKINEKSNVGNALILVRTVLVHVLVSSMMCLEFQL